MYYLVIRQFIRSLKNLDALLEKATAHAQKRKFDVNNFFTARLAPDMLPFPAQIRIACDNAKATAANLSGKENPKHEDNETNFEQLRGRVAKCIALLETFKPEDFAKATSETIVKLPYPPGKVLKADEYLLARQIPNFYFHLSTAYALLRQGGVEIGKSDFLGQLDFQDA
jgi:hypothetical protein